VYKKGQKWLHFPKKYVILLTNEKGRCLQVAILTGEYRHQIDEKGRIRIPAKLKELLGSSPMIARGSNGCLIVIEKNRAEEILRKSFDTDDFSDNENTRALRIMMSSATFPDEDKQGRFQLPPNLIRDAGIIKNIVTIGAYDRAEIWSEERWEAYLNDSERSDFDTCLRSLKKNG
jgi:MraZ protein